MAAVYPTYPVTTLAQAEDMIIFTSNQIHDVMNADATSVIEAEDGAIPSVRKALVDNMYFKTPQDWVASTQTTDPLQLKQFTDGGWYFAPTATVSTPVSLGVTPVGDTNWKPWSKDQSAVYQHAKRLAAEAGYNMVSGSFYFSGTLDSTDDVFFYEGDGKYYSWSGSFPKVIAAGSTPETTGGIGAGAWIDRTDSLLRSELGYVGGVELVTDAIDARNPVGNGYKSTSHYGGIVIGDNPIGVAGSDWASAVGLRDAINISRKIQNEPTDCHAFADKTVLDTPSDYGGYGAFDATTILRGAHNQDHVASFQARTDYQGSGTVENSWGMIIWPKITGLSTVLANVGIQIRNILTSTGAVNSNRGIDIDPKTAVNENIGVIVRQGICQSGQPVSFNSQQNSTGYSFYAPLGAAMYNRGNSAFGAGFASSPLGSIPFAVSAKESGSTVTGGFSADTGNGAFVSASGDSRVSFIANNSIKGYWAKSVDSNGFSPGADGTQPLGLSSKRWSVVYSSTGTINTSDENLKKFLSIEEAEKSAATEIKSVIKKYQFNDAIAIKGDSARYHFGVGAQTVGDIMRKHGLDPARYAFWCYDEWPAIAEEVREIITGRIDENGNTIVANVTEEQSINIISGMKNADKNCGAKFIETNRESVVSLAATESGNRYGIRYEELIMFILSSM